MQPNGAGNLKTLLWAVAVLIPHMHRKASLTSPCMAKPSLTIVKALVKAD
jgi:hypothetical protein